MKHSSNAVAFPTRRRTEANPPASIMRCFQELRMKTTAGQDTRTRTARFDSVLNPAIACALNARLTDAISLQLNAQVNAAVAAGLD